MKIESLLNEAYPPGAPTEVARLLLIADWNQRDDALTTLERAASQASSQENWNNLEASRSPLTDLPRRIPIEVQNLSFLRSQLQRPQIHSTAEEVGKLMMLVSGQERLIADLKTEQTRQEEERVRSEALQKKRALLKDVVKLICLVLKDDQVAVYPEEIYDLLPQDFQNKFQHKIVKFREKAEEEEAKRRITAARDQERQEAEAKARETATAAAREREAADLQAIETLDRDGVVARLFSLPHERQSVMEFLTGSFDSMSGRRAIDRITQMEATNPNLVRGRLLQRLKFFEAERRNASAGR